MFLAMLEDHQKPGFMVLANKVAVADGEDSLDELDALDDLKKEMNFTGEVDMSRVVGTVDVTPFDTHRSRVIVALELLLIAYADEYVHEAEIQIVRDVCFLMNFNEEWLAVMGEWATSYTELMQEEKDEAWQKYFDALMQHAQEMMEVA